MAIQQTVAVVGLGYVGLPLATLAATKGFLVLGYDISEERVAQLASGQSYIDDVPHDALNQETLSFTTDPKQLGDADVIVIAVPTPLDEYKQPDLRAVRSAAKTVGAYMSKDTLVVLESTTYPGTTEEVLVPILLEESGLTLGSDFFVAFAPERVDPGNSMAFDDIPKVVGGLTPEHTDRAVTFYQQLLNHVHPVSSPRVAEMTKLLENMYRLVNISMINELALLSGKMNIDIWEVIDAAKTKPYGFQAFYPGPGAGGHCIPLDPFYLAWKAKEYDFSARFVELAGDINYRMPEYALSKVSYAMNTQKKALNGSRMLVLGVAYKKNIGDVRESPILRLMMLLEHKGVDVSYYDPHVAHIYPHGHISLDLKGTSADVLDSLDQYDAVVIGTAHDGIDYEHLAKQAPLVIDLRNAITSRGHDHVFGF